MNSLNVSSKPVTVTRALPPLVVDVGNGAFAWIEKGHGFLLHTAVGQWHPLTDAPGIGGTVLKADQVAALVLSFGSPFKPKCAGCNDTGYDGGRGGEGIGPCGLCGGGK